MSEDASIARKDAACWGSMNLRPEGGTHHLSISMLPIASWRSQSFEHPRWFEPASTPVFSSESLPRLKSPSLQKLRLSPSLHKFQLSPDAKSVQSHVYTRRSIMHWKTPEQWKSATRFERETLGMSSSKKSSSMKRSTTLGRDGISVDGVFRRFDADGSGAINAKAELMMALNALGLKSDAAAVAAVMAKYDKDGNGMLSLKEFRMLVKELDKIEKMTEGGGGSTGGDPPGLLALAHEEASELARATTSPALMPSPNAPGAAAVAKLDAKLGHSASAPVLMHLRPIWKF